MASSMKVNMPSTRKGWMDWYIKRYGQKARSKEPIQRELDICATQVAWFQLNILAFGDRSYSPEKLTVAPETAKIQARRRETQLETA